VAKCRRTGMIVLCLTLSWPTFAMTRDLTGVYASSADLCPKVFERKGNKISFSRNSDLHGSGFIIEGNQLRGKIARCTIKSSSQSGNVVNMLAGCSTDIMLNNVQFRFRVDSDDRIVRLFPGMDGMEFGYSRCVGL
jgi:hypothetical protein